MPPLTKNVYDARKHGARCDECPLKNTCNPVRPAPASPGHLPRLAFIGEYPGAVEASTGKAFTGPTGQLLRGILGNRVRHTHLTYALLCTRPRNITDRALKQAIRACRPRLAKELKQYAPKALLQPCGKPTMSATLGSDRMAIHLGTLEQGQGPFANYQVVGNYNPVHALTREPTLTALFLPFLERAWGYATGEIKGYVEPSEYILHADDRAVAALREINASPASVAFDVENVPSQNVLTCVGLSNGTTTVTVPWNTYYSQKQGEVLGLEHFGYAGKEIRKLVIEIVATHQVITQNGAHDVREGKAHGIIFENGFDTLLAHAVVYPALRHNLEDIALQFFPMRRWKRAFNSNADIKGDDKWVEVAYEDLRRYNSMDAFATKILEAPLRAELERYGKD